MVWMNGLEPTTPCMSSKCSNQLSYTHIFCCSAIVAYKNAKSNTFFEKSFPNTLSLICAYTAIKERGALPDEKTRKRKVIILMLPKDFGLFCIDQAPDMPDMPEESTFPPHISLAMMYVPFQRFEKLYDEDKALKRGTLFEALDFPFYGGKRGDRR